MTTDMVTVKHTMEPREAFDVLASSRFRLAPAVDDNGDLVGILTRTGALRSTIYRPALDRHGRLRVAAAIGVNGDVAGRASKLLAMGVDCLVVDTAHGHQERMIEALGAVRALDPSVPGRRRQRGRRPTACTTSSRPARTSSRSASGPARCARPG